MKNIIICDIDGTLSDASHRLKYIKGPIKDRDWKKFYSLMTLDPPRQNTIDVVKILAKKYALVLLTGRPVKYQKQTMDWLLKHKIHAPFLIMREDKDFRPGCEYKEEVYEKQFKGKANIVAIFEDDKKVVEMWRGNGLTCFQVDDWSETQWKKSAEHYAWQSKEYKKNYLETFKKCDELAAENEKLKGKKK